jgi:tetratricopeptide (TPR) repeat protein
MVAALLFPFLMAVAAQAAPPARQPAEDTPPIIVTGKRLEDSQALLRACLARKCPPDEDIAATLAYAENLFVAGDYEKARTVLRRSLGRNRKHADRYPVPVSDLYRSNALVANHLGFEEDYFQSTWGTLRALKEGIPDPDWRQFGARMEIARMTARLRGFEEGVREYGRVAKDAEKAGRPDIAVLARLRGLAMEHRLRPSSSIRREIEKIAASTGPQTQYASSAAKLYLARLAGEAGKIAEAEAMIREVAGTGIKALILVYAPPYQLSVQEMNPTNPTEIDAPRGNPAYRYGGNFDGMWIDVGFWVQANGRVSEVRVLRKSGSASWADPLLKSIQGRLYAPLEQPSYRQERYTYTAGWEQQTGSRMMRRSPRARVEYLDLTMRETVPPPQ